MIHAWQRFPGEVQGREAEGGWAGLYLRTGCVLNSAGRLSSPTPLPLTADSLTAYVVSGFSPVMVTTPSTLAGAETRRGKKAKKSSGLKEGNKQTLVFPTQGERRQINLTLAGITSLPWGPKTKISAPHRIGGGKFSSGAELSFSQSSPNQNSFDLFDSKMDFML